jgi:hypothetical protein
VTELKPYTEITKCRTCENKLLITVLSLGEQHLTGVFPKEGEAEPSKGPLDLMWCPHCGLLQMKQSYNIDEMYGDNYGYRSGLNKSMVEHLTNKVHYLEKLANLRHGDVVVDIGSNDATLLKGYTIPCKRIGIDPTGIKFKAFYPADINLLPTFFSANQFVATYPDVYPKIITSVAMFYDLEDPALFVRGIANIIHPEGLWHTEQAYMPSMLRSTAYDAVCHEHLEFYSFGVVKNLIESNGMRVIDVTMNGINGGSFAVTSCKPEAHYLPNTPVINWMLRQEKDLNSIRTYRDFEDAVSEHKDDLTTLINALVNDGKKVFGYGASTKGNVMLQFCGLTRNQIPYIADVNPDKYGAYTPGTHIPIISEEEAKKTNPDYFLVFPWHFKSTILEREKEWMANGGKFIFPLPEIEII